MQNIGNTDNDWDGRGHVQESKCRDPLFAILFYVTVIAMVGIAAAYGPSAVETGGNDAANPEEYSGYLIASVIIVLISFVMSGAGLSVMMCIPETLIKVSLIFSVIMAGVWMIMAFLSGQVLMAILGAVFFLISCCYAYTVWSRIPFATANLVTAITAVRANLGGTVYAYVFTIIAGIWCICWSVAFVGIMDQTNGSCDNANEQCDEPSYGILFVLFVAFYFVHQVLEVRMKHEITVCISP